MAVVHVTDVPTLIAQSVNGSASSPSQTGIQVKNGQTGTVYIAATKAECIAGQTNYISEQTSILSVDLTAGNAVWGVCDTGLSVDVVEGIFGPK